MDTQKLVETAKAMMAEGRGLLAMDESLPTANKRFAPLGIPQTEAMRRIWRDLIVTAPGLGRSISGAILFDETLRQTTLAGQPFAEALEKVGIIPGIKVDAGSKPLAGFPDEEVTEGLDGLRERFAEYAGMGARFAKWRAVIRVSDGTPTHGALSTNAHALARYAGLAQEAGIVPIVEPEVLMDGSHGLEQCRVATEDTLAQVFAALREQRVLLQGMVLKPNMVVPGLQAADQSTVEAVADTTVECFLRTVPAAVAGIAFLSGGQEAEIATKRLDAMNRRWRGKMPWPLTFSFSRAIQQPALDLWAGKPENVNAAQDILVHRASCNAAARRGEYNAGADGPKAA